VSGVTADPDLKMGGGVENRKQRLRGKFRRFIKIKKNGKIIFVVINSRIRKH